jgi:hypothetical protein
MYVQPPECKSAIRRNGPLAPAVLKVGQPEPSVRPLVFKKPPPVVAEDRDHWWRLYV